jgi:GTP-binding protein HflX
MKDTLKPTSKPYVPAILVLTVPPERREQEADRAAEMKSLMDTAGRQLVGTVTQHLARPCGATYIGSGKVDELAAAMAAHGAEEVVFDAPLSPRQQGNIEETVKHPVLDYEGLILEIFARNARTDQAKLAVELAQAEYLKSRLRRLWTHLDRQSSGGTPGASGFLTGTGEKQIEMDRRLVRRKIQTLKDRLEGIEARCERTVAARGDCFNVALVGYTNAGKSTLMNALTGAGVLAEDRLFATLDTRTARLPLERHRNAVISDTVGFIRDLPPGLIASFHATLAEVREADLLLHVVDAASPAMSEQVAAVEDVLHQIGADHLPAIMVFNKADRCFSRTLVGSFRKKYRHTVQVSALVGTGLPELQEAISAAIDRRQVRLTLRFSAADGALGALIRRRVRIEREEYDGDTAVLTVVADESLAAELRERPGLTVGQSAGPTS